jgi:hypothetical protein
MGSGEPARWQVQVAIGLALVAVLAVVILIVRGGSDSKPVVTAPPTAVQPPTPKVVVTPPPRPAKHGGRARRHEPTRRPSSSSSSAPAVRQVVAVIRDARAGRSALVAHDLPGAIRNRRALLARLSALQAPAELAPSVRALRTAFAYALSLDRSCGFKCPAAKDAEASKLKARALGLFNPLARRYAKVTFAPADI